MRVGMNVECQSEGVAKNEQAVMAVSLNSEKQVNTER